MWTQQRGSGGGYVVVEHKHVCLLLLTALKSLVVFFMFSTQDTAVALATRVQNRSLDINHVPCQAGKVVLMIVGGFMAT